MHVYMRSACIKDVKREMTGKQTLKAALKATLPVMAGYLVLGSGFGIVMQTKGYGAVWSVAMSLLIYAGSMQFVAVNLLTGGASLLTAAVTTLLVNARHLFYGISMADRYRNRGKAKPYLIFSLTDETYSLLATDQGDTDQEDRPRYELYVSLLDQSCWVLGSLIGGLLGSLITFDTSGIDFALTALFLTIVVDQWRSGRHHLYTLLGLAISMACLLIFGPDSFLIPSMGLILAAVCLRRKQEVHTHD